MESIIKKRTVLMLILLLVTPLFVQAFHSADHQEYGPVATNSSPGGSEQALETPEQPSKNNKGGGVVTCTGPGNCTISEFFKMLERITNTIIMLALSISAIVISYAGFLYLTAGGDSGKVKKAHEVLQKVVIGLIIILTAWLLLDLFYDVIGVNTDYKPLKSS